MTDAVTFREWAPPPDVGHLVEALWVLRTSAKAHRVLPDARVDLIVRPGQGVHVAGPDTRAELVPAPGGTTVGGLRFRPGALRAVLAVTADEITDTTVRLDELWDRDGRQLDDAVAAHGDVRVGIDAAVATLRRRLRRGTRAPVDDDIQAWVRAVERGLVAESSGSSRHFRRRVGAAVGYGPAMLQRVARLQRALRMGRTPGARLADVAASAGYFDQAHFTREAQALGGASPTVLLDRRRSTSG